MLLYCFIYCIYVCLSVCLHDLCCNICLSVSLSVWFTILCLRAVCLTCMFTMYVCVFHLHYCICIRSICLSYLFYYVCLCIGLHYCACILSVCLSYLYVICNIASECLSFLFMLDLQYYVWMAVCLSDLQFRPNRFLVVKNVGKNGLAVIEVIVFSASDCFFLSWSFLRGWFNNGEKNRRRNDFITKKVKKHEAFVAFRKETTYA